MFFRSYSWIIIIIKRRSVFRLKIKQNFHEHSPLQGQQQPQPGYAGQPPPGQPQPQQYYNQQQQQQMQQPPAAPGGANPYSRGPSYGQYPRPQGQYPQTYQQPQ